MKADIIYRIYGRPDMQKYNYQLDLVSQNSNSQIIKYILGERDILEFGPAFGRLTRYLSEQLKCKVDIVEFDEESGSAAATFARTACVGTEEGDIEKYLWESKLRTRKYDYIIFADVLEHLRHPDMALRKCRAYLKEDGSILCAVPNIAHSSIIISLWNNDFTYNSVGLLDDSHVHFFTRKSFEELAQKEGYNIVSIEEVTSSVGTNEINWGYEQVPAMVAHELHMRKEGDIYQYIFQLKKKNVNHIMQGCLRNYGTSSGYTCTCFVKEALDSEFCKEKSLQKKFNSSQINIYFELSAFCKIAGVCVDLIEASSLIKISKVEVDGELLEYQTSGVCLEDKLYVFNEKSQIFIVIPYKDVSMLHIEYEILLVNHAGLMSLKEVAEKHNHQLDAEKRRIQPIKQKLNEITFLLEDLQKQIVDKDSLLALQGKQIEHKNLLHKELSDKFETTENQLQTIKHENELLKEELTSGIIGWLYKHKKTDK